MGDIKFACVKCGQHFVIDDRVAGYWVSCTECGVKVQVPKVSRFYRLWSGMVGQIPVVRQAKRRFASIVLLIPAIGLFCYSDSPSVFPSSVTGFHRPPRPCSLLKRGETALAAGACPEAAEAWQTLLSAFPGSEEAERLRDLIRIVREGWQADPGACTEEDVRLIGRQIELKAKLLHFYAGLPRERQAFCESLFDPRTFRDKDLTVNGVLFTLKKVEEARDRTGARVSGLAANEGEDGG